MLKLYPSLSCSITLPKYLIIARSQPQTRLHEFAACECNQKFQRWHLITALLAITTGVRIHQWPDVCTSAWDEAN